MKSRLLLAVAAVSTVLVGCSSASGSPASSTTPGASSTAQAALTQSGHLLQRFEATLSAQFGQDRPCADNASKTALRFVPCKAPAARFSPYAFTFAQGEAKALGLTRRAPRAGTFGVNNAPVQVGHKFVQCSPNSYLLRTFAVSFTLGCS